MGDDVGVLVRTVSVIATLCGMLVVALLIGLVSSTLGEQIENLRKVHVVHYLLHNTYMLSMMYNVILTYSCRVEAL